ncbi:MAG: NYN domain-containing protein [Nanoarchaeota archaeon]|nr:NYN domain-containing protein [Nanoarchaeota archaeon]
MNQSKHQRIGVFVDVQNLYYSAKDFYHKKVNFQAILREAVKGRSLIRAMTYVIKADVKDEANFFDALRAIGYEVRSKDLQTFPGGHKKGDWDIGIAMDMIELAPKLDTMVLISGDGDFIPLVQHLRRALGCRVELIAFGKSASSKLIEEVDSYTDLDKTPMKFLRSSTRRTTSRATTHINKASTPVSRISTPVSKAATPIKDGPKINVKRAPQPPPDLSRQKGVAKVSSPKGPGDSDKH